MLSGGTVAPGDSLEEMASRAPAIRASGITAPAQGLVVFHLSDKMIALPVAEVQRVAPMVTLAHPPGLPPFVEGILNLSGTAIPVFRLDRLFELPEQRISLYSMLVVVRDAGNNRFAILVDQVSHILTADAGSFLPLEESQTWNGCATAALRLNDHTVAVLSPARILLEQEKRRLKEFQAITERRQAAWEGTIA